ncbi:hypothetical protein KBB68_01530 [Candidatus Babeliales bacterium]|nr:hypothetical protein [Candidatus Babeliales bacterium]
MASDKKSIIAVAILILSICNIDASSSKGASSYGSSQIRAALVTAEEKKIMEENIKKSFERARRQNGVVSPVPQE